MGALDFDFVFSLKWDCQSNSREDLYCNIIVLLCLRLHIRLLDS